MQASSKSIAQALGNVGHMHFVLPHFQREYRWQKHDWQTLWNDAMTTYDALKARRDGERAHLPEHFLGALVLVPQGVSNGTIPVHRLVDGQQRLTTLSLLLCAFAEATQSDEYLKNNARALITNSNAKGDLKWKILPTTKNNDRAIYCAITDGKPVPMGKSHVLPAFEFFRAQLQNSLASERIETELFFEVLTAAFQVVWVELDKDEDAHQIFESLNTKGQRLSEVDLVRNYIAMRLPSGEQERVFFEIWAPIEAILDDERAVGRSGMGELTSFLRHYDAMQSGALPPENKIYARFRDEMKDHKRPEFIEQLRELRRFAALYDGLLRPDKGTNAALRAGLRRLNALDITVSYPFLLMLADRYERGEIALKDYVGALQTLENYLVRRFVCGEPTAYLNKMFASLGQSVNFSDLPASLPAILSRKNYPSDDKIHQVAPRRDFYGKAGVKEKTVMLFERINTALYAGTDVIPTLGSAPTIEHILPQTMSHWWREHLGAEAQRVSDEWLHTLGNLTLVTSSYNASLSNDSFPEKRAKLRAHGLKLNSEYFAPNIEQWNARAIQGRADWLIEKIIEVWPSFSETSAPLPTRATPKATPVAVTIRGIVTPTKYWSDVMRAVGEFLVIDGADFDVLSQQFPHLIAAQPTLRMPHKLSNGWFLELHSNTTTKLGYCRKLLKFHGVDEDEWEIEEI